MEYPMVCILSKQRTAGQPPALRIVERRLRGSIQSVTA
jgi:hypothetical protein